MNVQKQTKLQVLLLQTLVTLISFFVCCLISVMLNESRRLKRRKIWPD